MGFGILSGKVTWALDIPQLHAGSLYSPFSSDCNASRQKNNEKKTWRGLKEKHKPKRIRYIYPYSYQKYQLNVGEYISPVEPIKTGSILFKYFECHFHQQTIPATFESRGVGFVEEFPSTPESTLEKLLDSMCFLCFSIVDMGYSSHRIHQTGIFGNIFMGDFDGFSRIGKYAVCPMDLMGSILFGCSRNLVND